MRRTHKPKDSLGHPWYRKIIGSFAKVAAPLTDLIKKGQLNKIVWKPEHETAFKTFKGLLTSALLLCLPDFTCLFVLNCDALIWG